MQWLVLIWAVVVLVMYIGGYLLPAEIGFYTFDSGKLYAVFLVIGVTASVLRAVAAREERKAPRA